MIERGRVAGVEEDDGDRVSGGKRAGVDALYPEFLGGRGGEDVVDGAFEKGRVEGGDEIGQLNTGQKRKREKRRTDEDDAGMGVGGLDIVGWVGRVVDAGGGSERGSERGRVLEVVVVHDRARTRAHCLPFYLFDFDEKWRIVKSIFDLLPSRALPPADLSCFIQPCRSMRCSA